MFQTEIDTSTDKAAVWLRRGEVIGIPTETVYGLAGNALNEDAVLKIFKVKNRPHFDPLIVHVHHREAISRYVETIPDAAAALLEKFSPGPLTVLLPKKPVIPYVVTSGLDTVAIRVPNHPLTLELLRKIDFPLAAPSANPFGYISPTTSYHVYDQLHGRIPYILDGGATDIGIESTIVGFQNDRVTVYRLGGLSVEDIEKVTGSVTLDLQRSSDPRAPGMLQHHYAPRKPLHFINSPDEAPDTNAGYIVFQHALPHIPAHRQIILSPAGDLTEAAKKLFSAMRQLDKSDVPVIYAVRFPDVGLGRAINDRLMRASASPSQPDN
ncbi:MAG: L-threonylcarbamoyladenylate synthase [Chitinophagales bacterium]|nr:L-threonylcarbamoyladenylate synthase [Chitinophagales bacterium]MDW8419916.1 L-threonylcarbamoyladenylate synthase [Chitinophagales bacterium]